MDAKITEHLKAKAVVLGLGINGLAIVRSLGMHGVEVWGVFVGKDEPGRFSRYCNAVQFPSLEEDEPRFLDQLVQKLGNPHSRPVLFGQSDNYVMFLSRNRDRLQGHFRFLLPNPVLLETLVSKDRAAAYVADKGLRIPATYCPKNKGDIEKILNKIPYPCLMKPINSFSLNLGAKALTLSDKSSFRAFLRDHAELIGQVVFQELIPGGDSNTYQATTYVANDGSILPIFTMRKIRQYPSDFGVTSYGVSEKCPFIANKVQEFLSVTGYRGFISVEFKKHPHTGEWFYIEANPRLPYYHALMRDSGINYPYIYYQDMGAIKSIAESSSIKAGVSWVCFRRDFGSFVQKFWRRQIAIIPWLISLTRARSFAFMDKKDLKPCVHATYVLAKALLQKSLKAFARSSSRIMGRKGRPLGSTIRGSL